MIKYILLLPFFIIFSCKGQTNPDCLVKLEEKLSPKVNEENKIGEVINIKDEVNCFDWDTLIVQLAMVNKETTEKDLGIKIPFYYYDDFLNDERVARLLFVKNNTVVHYIIQNSGVDRKTFETAKSIKSYSFVNLINNDNGSIKIPREEAVFEMYSKILRDKNKEISKAFRSGMSIKVKE
ncbi:hypothetical protein [Chryseobacterium indologenes]|uniref:hypothetical protein n=1 Tax=Chryseobacterium indologenes TaxID=253 RepID=UPI001EE6AFDF|nr:hypothetical protein [Chryseobacterium indologenes]